MTNPKGKRMTATELHEAEISARADAAQLREERDAWHTAYENLAAKAANAMTNLKAEIASLREERDAAVKFIDGLSAMAPTARMEQETLKKRLFEFMSRAAVAEQRLAAPTRPLSEAEAEAEVRAADAWLMRVQSNPYIAAYEAANTRAVLRRLSQANKTAREDALRAAEAVADREFQRWTKHAERASKRSASGELLKAVGYQGAPDFESVEADAYRDMAGTIAEAIRALSTQETKPPG